MNNTSKIPVAVIGCGTVAQYGHLPTIVETPELELVAIADTQRETADKISSSYGVTGYTDYNELLARDDIEAVTVSTPLPFHYEVVAAALEAGKHVLCEKPMAETPEQSQHMVDLASKHQKLLAINFGYRFDEAIEKMRECLLSGELGRLQVVRLVYNWSAHGIEGAAGVRRAQFMQHGGGSMDCAVHFIDLARFLSDSEYQSMSAYGQWVEPEFRGPGHMLIQARLQNGALAHIEASLAYTHRSKDRTSVFQLEVIGERGIVSWNYLTPTPGTGNSMGDGYGELQILTEDRTEVGRTSAAKKFASVYGSWADALRRGTLQGTALATGEDGHQATYWTQRALELAEQERQVANNARSGELNI